MINKNTLAQYWEVSSTLPPHRSISVTRIMLIHLQDFGHVSFYERVHTDDYLKKL